MSAQQIAMVKAKDSHDKKVLIDRSNAAKLTGTIKPRAAGNLMPIEANGLYAQVRRWLGF
jgi:hypothetical protein